MLKSFGEKQENSAMGWGKSEALLYSNITAWLTLTPVPITTTLEMIVHTRRCSRDNLVQVENAIDSIHTATILIVCVERP